MANIKTAISIEKPLFEEVEILAKELKISRSRVFALAVQDFLQQHRNQKLLEAINRAYDDHPDIEDERYLNRIRPRHRDLVKGQW